MKKTRFRIKENDTIKATISDDNTGKLLATVYDSGFTTIGEVVSRLLSKCEYTSARTVYISIYNQETEQIKQFKKHLTK